MWGAVVGAVVAAVGGAIGIAAGLYVYDDYAYDFVPPDQVAVNTPYDGAKIYDRNGEFLYELVDELNGLRRPVEFDADLAQPHRRDGGNGRRHRSSRTPASTCAASYARPGRTSTRSAPKDILEGSGGSSISQQLAKNLYIPEDERVGTLDRPQDQGSRLRPRADTAVFERADPHVVPEPD